jgi:hypothetical protein
MDDLWAIRTISPRLIAHIRYIIFLGCGIGKRLRTADSGTFGHEQRVIPGIKIGWELAAARPDRYCPDPAGALTSLGNRYSELDRLAEALPHFEEAVAIYRCPVAAQDRTSDRSAWPRPGRGAIGCG